MNNLIQISKHNINNEELNAVDARELHKNLEIGKFFANWVKT